MLHILTGTAGYSLMMCLDAADLKSRAGWDGAAGLSRQHLLSELSSKLTPGDSLQMWSPISNMNRVYRIYLTFSNDP